MVYGAILMAFGDVDVKVKQIVFVFILFVNVSFLRAQTLEALREEENKIQVFFNVSAGLLISSSQTENGLISGRININNVYYKADQEGIPGFSGIFSMHGGVFGIGGSIALETGVDICLNNKNGTLITITNYPNSKPEFARSYSYSSLDIPILAAMPLKITDKFIIRPAAGLYISIPVGKAEYRQEVKVFSEPTLTESYTITSKVIAGFEADIKFMYMLGNLKRRIFLDCGYKYDFNPLHGVTNAELPSSWSIERQTLSFSLGYENIF